MLMHGMRREDVVVLQLPEGQSLDVPGVGGQVEPKTADVGHLHESFYGTVLRCPSQLCHGRLLPQHVI